MQSVWQKTEKTIGVIQILTGVFFLVCVLWILFSFVRYYSARIGKTFLEEFLSWGFYLNPFLIFCAWIIVSGILLIRKNKFGWIGTIITNFLITVGLTTFLVFNPTRLNEDTFNRDLILLLLVLSCMFIVLLFSREIRNQYNTTIKDWLISVGIIAFLILDWFVIR